MSNLHFLLVPFLALVGWLAPGWLGVMLDPESEQPLVIEVVPGSPAEKAGIRVGDRILAIDDMAVPTVDDLLREVGKREAGSKVKVKVRRDEAERVLEVVLAARPSDLPAPAERDAARTTRPGTEAAPPDARPAPQEQREQKAEPREEGERAGARARTGRAQPAQERGRPFLGVALEAGDDGVQVAEVLDDSPAKKAGVSQGRLRSIARQKVSSLQDVDRAMAALRPGQRVALEIEAGGTTHTFHVVLGAVPARGEEREAAAPAPARDEGVRADDTRREVERAAARERQRAEQAKRQQAKEAPAEPKPGAQAQANARPQQAGRAKQPAAPGDVRAALRELAGKKPLLLAFGAAWDASSKALQKSLQDEKVKEALGDREVLWIDTDRHGAIADQYDVQQIPHMVLLDAAGKRAGVIEGFQPADLLAEKLKELQRSGERAARAREPKPAAKPEAPRPGPTGPAARAPKADAKPEAGAPPGPRQGGPAGPARARADGDRDLATEIRALREEIRELRTLLQELTREQQRRR